MTKQQEENFRILKSTIITMLAIVQAIETGEDVHSLIDDINDIIEK